jgi:hypothetical protein
LVHQSYKYMETFTVKTLVALIIILILFSGCDLTLTDISPDRSNGVSDGGQSTAGLALNIAGDKNGLYAIGLNSGVWKTEIDNAGLFNKWRQLPESPRYAHCIAVDPNSPDHIAVGEREGDAIYPAQNHCGLWESFDGGKTFDAKYYFNPLDHPCRQDKRTQVINGVVITNKGTILISTPCGVGRKEPFAPTFTYAHFTTSQDDQTFTGIAMFKDWIVARTKTSIFISNDDGNNWNENPIQLTFPNQSFTQDYLGDTAGNYSVAIIQLPDTGNVFVYVPVTRSPNDPNQGSCVIFNNQGGYWTFQSITERGLGVKLGGSVFVKSFFSNSSKLKSIVGGNTNLIYCAGQNLFRATSIYADGTAEWENIANGNIAYEPKPSDIHGDFWDFAIDPLGWYAWVSCDGGVYYYAMDPQQSTVDLNSDEKYINLNSGLHTQHIHQSFVAGFSGNAQGEVHYGYGSQDNGGWKFGNAILAWQQIGLGDVNIVEGDQGNSQLILIGTNLQTALLSGLGFFPPFGAKVGPKTINYGNSGSFQFIQTLASESPYSLLDAVMLTTLPLQYAKDPGSDTDKQLTNVPTDLGTQSGTVILRNSAFAANPDINLSMGVGWSIEVNDFPAGAMAFWVSGGHVDPTYYLLCNQVWNGVSTGVLYKRKKSENAWTAVTAPDSVPIIPYAANQVQHGPVFVNPYDPTAIYVSCIDGIYSSVYTTAVRGKTKGGLTFTKDVELTNLVSGNGKYPIDRTFPGGNGVYVRHSNQSNLNAMYPVSWVAFNRFKPEQIVASSPFTGVFFKDGTKKWRNLSDVLPKPFTPVSSVNINNQGIYVTTEGRGMFLITNY